MLAHIARLEENTFVCRLYLVHTLVFVYYSLNVYMINIWYNNKITTECQVAFLLAFFISSWPFLFSTEGSISGTFNKNIPAWMFDGGCQCMILGNFSYSLSSRFGRNKVNMLIWIILRNFYEEIVCSLPSSSWHAWHENGWT